MDAGYVLACGIVWRKTADPEAGWDLLEALQSPDPCLQRLARTMLAERGEDSMRLLESALESGVVCTQVAGPCMAEILRNLKAKEISVQTIPERLTDLSIC